MPKRTEPIAICARCHTDVMPHHHHAFGRGGWQHWSPEDCEAAVDAALRESNKDATWIRRVGGAAPTSSQMTPNALRALAWRLEHPKAVQP